MARIAQKSCVALFPLRSLKKAFLWGRTDANQQKHTKNLKLKSDKKLCQYDDNCNNNYYFIDNKDKNSNSNSRDYYKR